MYLIVKLISFILTRLPVNSSLFLGRIFGHLFYLFAFKKRRVAYVNIKRALGDKYGQKERKIILRNCFINFTQNIIEALYLPRIDKAYLDKYVKIEGLEFIDEALKNNKGVIIAGMHFGSWEISSGACALLGYNYSTIYKEQKNPVLNNLLNSFRQNKGSKVISRGYSIREIIKSLHNNEVIGLAMDQGQVEGSILVDFFNDLVLLPTGTLRIALKTSATIIPAYIRRINGAYHQLIFLPPLNLEGINEDNLGKVLREYAAIGEDFITKYPDDYTWFYKRWKRSPKRRCLVLSDGKAGHLSQSRGLIEILKKSRFEINEKIVEIRFKNKFAKFFVNLCALTSGGYCQGCLACLKNCLTKDSYEKIENCYMDIIISCGSSLAAVNLILKNENNSQAITIMKPGIFNPRKFNLIISPQHDHLGTNQNSIKTDLALNTINKDNLFKDREILISQYPCLKGLTNCVSVFLGGSNRNQSLDVTTTKNLIIVLKTVSKKLDLNLLITTSRRTSQEVEQAIKDGFSGFANCRLLILANKDNPKGAVGGLLALSDLVVISSDSISMVSEAVCSLKPVIVFKLKGLENTKHEKFINNLREGNYIGVAEIENIEKSIEGLLKNNTLNPISENLSALEKEIISRIS